MSIVVVPREDVELLTRYTMVEQRVHVKLDELRDIAMRTIMSYVTKSGSNLDAAPRELKTLYELYLDATGLENVRRVVKLDKKFSLREKYPWLRPVLEETERLVGELEELEELELELKVKNLL